MFLKQAKDYISDGYTLVDNVFLTRYLPSADPIDVKVYLYGLALSKNAEDVTPEKMAEDLGLSFARLTQAFDFWHKKGIIDFKSAPFSVSYASVKQPLTPALRVETEKYKTFTEEVKRQLNERKIPLPNDFKTLYDTIEEYKIEPNAMLLVISHCLGMNKCALGNFTGLAEAWAKKGLTTYDAVAEQTRKLKYNSDRIRQVFAALNMTRQAAFEDSELYSKWSESMGFEHDAILTAARSLKSQSGKIEALDRLLCELLDAKATRPHDIEAYINDKKETRKVATDICKALGVFYESTDEIIKTYVKPWLNLGFEKKALINIARLCLSGTNYQRTFEYLNKQVQEFKKEGKLTLAAVEGAKLKAVTKSVQSEKTADTSYAKHNWSEEQLKSVLTNFDELKAE